MERKRSCKKAALLKSKLWECSSSEKVAATEVSIFWKSDRCKKGSSPEKVENTEYFFSEKLTSS